MSERPTIIEFVTDPQFLGLSVSPAQDALLRAIYGLPLDEAQFDLWTQCTGRATYPALPFGEASIICGVRAGKDSRIAAPVACYEAVFGGHETRLAKGERATIPLVAQDAEATATAFGYVRDYLTGSPLLAGLVEDVWRKEIRLTSRVSSKCFPCTQRSLRSWSMPAAVMDEVAYFRLAGQANADVEVQASIRRGAGNFIASKLIKISTPYMRSGVIYDDFARAFGHEDPDLLVWRASTALMNPTFLAARLERERRLDPTRFAREYEAEFAEDLDVLLPAAWVDQGVMVGRHELPPRDGIRYVVTVDPAGTGPDAITMNVLHLEGPAAERRIVQDLVRGWGKSRAATVDLQGVVGAMAALCRAYRVSMVTGDQYAKGWVEPAFRAHGIRYDAAPAKAEAYLALEPWMAQGRVELLDHPQLIRELKMLERRPQAGGRVVVDHPRGGHDDYANVLALGVMVAARAGRQSAAVGLPIGVGGPASENPATISPSLEPARHWGWASGPADDPRGDPRF